MEFQACLLSITFKTVLYVSQTRPVSLPYSGKFVTIMSVWRGKVWQIDRFSHKVIISKIWMVLVWRITDDSPNFPAIQYSKVERSETIPTMKLEYQSPLS